ncbi:MAG: cobalamin biosynthesis protein, partial [Desulfobulbia bacterium]
MLFNCAFLEVGLLSILIDRIAGYPDGLYRTIGHPVAWMGFVLRKAENWLNQTGLPRLQSRVRGVFALFILLVPVCLITFVLNQLLCQYPIGKITLAILGSSLLAQKSLRQHADAVIYGLEDSLAE